MADDVQVRSVWCSHVANFSGAPGTLVQLPYEEAVQHIEEDLLLAIYAAKCYKLQDACEPTPELLELCFPTRVPGRYLGCNDVSPHRPVLEDQTS